MRTEPEEPSKQQGGRTGVRTEGNSGRSSGEQVDRSKTMEWREEEELRGSGGARRMRRAASEGGGCEEKRRLRWRINQLENEKLLLSSSHNQEVCRLQAELARLRSAVEHGEAQGAELRYQLTMCCRDKRSLTERLQQDQHALQQRDRLVRNCGAENQRLRRLLQEQEEVLQEANEKRVELQREEEELNSRLRTERERRSGVKRRLQAELQRSRSELGAAAEAHRRTTSDLEAETRGHAHTQMLLRQAVQGHQETQDVFLDILTRIKEALENHGGSAPPTKRDGKPDAAEVVETLRSTLRTYREEVETLREENHSLTQLRSQLLEVQQEADRLSQEVCDWSDRTRRLQEEKEEREEREKEEKREREEKDKEEREKREMEEKREKEEKEQREKEEKEERKKKEKREKEEREKQEKAFLSFLHSLYQRLLAGCVLLPQPQCMLGNFSWQELCDVIGEQVEQLTSDLSAANRKVTHLQSVCDKKSVCVRELQRRHKCVLSRLEASVRRREEAWKQRHKHTLSQLQLCRSQCDLLTSDLSESLGQAASFQAACALLGGALSHTHRRRRWLCQQKALLTRRLEEREELEREVRRLASALGGGKEVAEEEEMERRRRGGGALRRWRRSVRLLMAVRKWRKLGRRSNVLLEVEGGAGGAPSVCVCGDADQGGGDGGDGGRCARWLRSPHLSSLVLSSVSDLRAELERPGSAHLIPAARTALSRLLQHFDQSEDFVAKVAPGEVRRGETRSGTKALVLTIQQHFLLFSQRLHSAEVERRSLRQELANQRRRVGPS